MLRQMDAQNREVLLKIVRFDPFGVEHDQEGLCKRLPRNSR